MKETSIFGFSDITADKYSLWALGEAKKGEFGLKGPFQVTTSPGDATYVKIESVVERMCREGDADASPTWWCEREYTPAELQGAELFLMRYPHPGEVAGKQTVYDWSGCCSFFRCESGRQQRAPLRFRLSRLPRSRPLVKPLDGEWLVPATTAKLLQAQRLAGFELERVDNDETATSGEPEHVPAISELSQYASGRELTRRAEKAGINLEVVSYPWLHTNEPSLWEVCVEEHNEWLRLRNAKARSKVPPEWYQLRLTSERLPVCPPTRFGINPFDLDPRGRYRCSHGPHGHVNGLRLVTEVYVNREDWDGRDVVATSNLVGLRGGYCVPEPLLLVSRRFRQTILSLKPRGVVFEVAHFTNEGATVA